VAVAGGLALTFASCSPGALVGQRSVPRASASGQPLRWPDPTPAISTGNLPEQASLYAVVVAEFVRLGWESVCVGAMPDPAAREAVAPSDDATAWLSVHDTHFRPKSACREDGEDARARRAG